MLAILEFIVEQFYKINYMMFYKNIEGFIFPENPDFRITCMIIIILSITYLSITNISRKLIVIVNDIIEFAFFIFLIFIIILVIYRYIDHLK